MEPRMHRIYRAPDNTLLVGEAVSGMTPMVGDEALVNGAAGRPGRQKGRTMSYYEGEGFGAGRGSSQVVRHSSNAPMRRTASKRTGSKKSMSTSSKGQWTKTVLMGTAVLAAAGQYTITIRPQHSFMAQDIFTDGTTVAATITSVAFGDRVVWQNPTGVPTGVFLSTGFMRGIVKGAKIRGGLDIIVQGAAGIGTVNCGFTGLKPQTTEM